MSIKLYWHNYRYFPYEKHLAEREVKSLTGLVPETFSDGLILREEFISLEKISQTTYFSSIVGPQQNRLIPVQAKLEASANGNASNNHAPVSKQNTRYSAHGLHEYRGKFNPQIVKVIGNILGVEGGDWIIDPFCGSGTTLLEALHNGWNAIGIDRNPLAIWIANAKIAVLNLSQQDLDEMLQFLSKELLGRIEAHDFKQPFTERDFVKIAGQNWRDRFSSLEYLSSWFIPDALAQFSIILKTIDQLLSPQKRLVAQVVLSDLVREMSLQEPADLRIRRRKSAPETINVILPFIATFADKIKAIKNSKHHLQPITSTQIAILGDMKNSQDLLNNCKAVSSEFLFDAAITSPPYATGLPYVDTDRLSLVLLGLIDAENIHDTQKSLIGNREISKLQRDELLAHIDNNEANLPPKTIEFCRQLKDAVGIKDGFRRQNVPAVLYKYFSDMAEGFDEVRKLLKPNAPYALVVGTNKTTLGGTSYIIDTPRFLVDIALSREFRLDEIIELDTYHRYDIHSTNSIRSESLILLST
ncbi:MAG: site-specific DNA-methyltransferase [Chloroflexi bacterium]|nr:site-specific DNA-methyltransferase [Chloroflexota bacterium]